MSPDGPTPTPPPTDPASGLQPDAEDRPEDLPGDEEPSAPDRVPGPASDHDSHVVTDGEPRPNGRSPG